MKDFIDFLDENADNFPLSFQNYKKIDMEDNAPKILLSKMSALSTESYVLHGFYRPITKTLCVSKINEVL
jgi:hypothetical protein